MAQIIQGLVTEGDGRAQAVAVTSEGQVKTSDATTRELLTALLEEAKKTNLLLLQLIHS